MKNNESVILRNFFDSKSDSKDSNYVIDSKAAEVKDANYVTDAKSYKLTTDARYEMSSSSERASAVNPLNRERKRSAKDIVSRILEKKLSSKASTHQDSVEIKIHGRTPGNIYTRDDGTQYILKTAEMHPTDREAKSNKNQFLCEYMSIAEYLLYNKAPVIGLATDSEFDTKLKKYKDPSQLFLRSEFIEGFIPLSHFVKIKLNISRVPEVNEITGFEKILAVCMFVGDWDFHRENLGVVTRSDKKMMVKVDFGLANSFYTNERLLREKLFSRLKDFGLTHVNVHAEKLKEAVDEIIKMDDSEIERIIKHRAYNLKRLGYVLDDNVLASYNQRRVSLSPFNDKGDNETDCRYQELENRYIDIYRNQKAVFKELSRSLDTIIRIVEPKKWLDNKWLYEIGNSIDPEFWAITNQRRIYPPAPEKTEDKEASADQLMRWKARLSGAKNCLENRIDRSGVDIIDKISDWRIKREGVNAVDYNIKRKISGWYIERDPRIIPVDEVNTQHNNTNSKWRDKCDSITNTTAPVRNKVNSMLQKLRTLDSAPVNKENGIC